jgi:hypothetical protein
VNLVTRTATRIPWTRGALAWLATGVLLAGCGTAAAPKVAQPAPNATSTSTTSPTSPPPTSSLPHPKPGIYADTPQGPFSEMDFSVGNHYLGPYGHGWVYIWAGGANSNHADPGISAEMQPGLRLYTGPATSSPTFGSLSFVGQYILPGTTGWASVTTVQGSTVTLLITQGGRLGLPGAVYHGPRQFEAGTATFNLATHKLSALEAPKPVAPTYGEPCGHPLPAHLLEAVNARGAASTLAPFPAPSVAPATSGITVPVSCQEAVATSIKEWPNSADLGVGLATYTSERFPKGRLVWAVDIDAPIPDPGALRLPPPPSPRPNFIVEVVDAYSRADLGTLTGTSSLLAPLSREVG